MARPRKEGLDYFSHDTDAVNDEKIELLKSLYKNDGYAFYFIMLERIYRNANFEIDVSDAETKEEMFQILSKKVGVELDLFKQILNTCMKYNCFDKELYESKGVITSYGIKRRAEMVTGKRTKMQEKYKKAKEVSGEVSDAETKEETKEETPQRKEKKTKEKEIKKNHYADNVTMTEDEHKKLIAEYGEAIIKEKIIDLDLWKGSKGKETKSDYLTVKAWIRKDQKEVKPQTKPNGIKEIPKSPTRRDDF